jgi:ABC-type transporter MlaC component
MRKPTVSKATKKILQTKLVSVSLVFLISYLLFSSPSRAESPTEQVRATVDKVLTLVRNPAAQKKNLRAQLAEVIYPRFDFAEMAKRSLGPHWARRTPEEQREFVKVFAALMGRSYADNIESYTSQNVLYTRCPLHARERRSELCASGHQDRHREPSPAVDQLQTPQRQQGGESVRPSDRRY